MNPIRLTNRWYMAGIGFAAFIFMPAALVAVVLLILPSFHEEWQAHRGSVTAYALLGIIGVIVILEGLCLFLAFRAPTSIELDEAVKVRRLLGATVYPWQDVTGLEFYTRKDRVGSLTRGQSGLAGFLFGLILELLLSWLVNRDVRMLKLSLVGASRLRIPLRAEQEALIRKLALDRGVEPAAITAR